MCFVQAAADQKYELVFSAGSVGRRPKNGAVVFANYRVSSGELPNGAADFSTDSAIDGHSNVIVTTAITATGGAISESIESIRFNAPRYFQTQERAVTTNDYKSLLYNAFPEITSINVYGGEDAQPPRFGKVIVSVDVTDADGVPEYKKNEYLQYIRERCSLSIDPIIIDPEFMGVEVYSTVHYNVNATTYTELDIESLVKSTIINYSTTDLNDFSVTLRASNLSSLIDYTETSILSNDTILKPYLTFVPSTTATNKIQLLFKNAVKKLPGRNATHLYKNEQSVSSTTFTFEGTSGVSVEDDGKGNLRLVRITPTSYLVVRETIGTVDYASGTITIPSLSLSAYDGDGIRFYIVPESNDITATQNKILRIKPTDIYVTISPERL